MASEDQSSRTEPAQTPVPMVPASGPTTPTTSTAVPTETTTTPSSRPPRKSSPLGTWFNLLICILLPLPAMLIDFHRPDVFDDGEIATVSTSIHSWDHQAEVALVSRFSFERLAPYYNNTPQWHRSPLVTWLHQLAFASIDDESITIDKLITAARSVSIISAIIALASLYWAGTSFGSRQTGLIAAILCAANPLFIYYARTACDIMPATAFIMLAIATALWAIRPLRPMPSFVRQLAGWVICGFATGAAMLALGPIALFLIIVPIAIIDLICPDRFSHLMGLLAAIIIGTLVVLPAAGIAMQYDDQAWWAWMKSLAPLTPEAPSIVMQHILSRFGLLLLALLPWTLWFIAAIGQPFSTSSSGLRRRLFLSWVLCISTTILMVFLKGPDIPGLAISLVVPLLPAASLLIGELFTQYANLADEARFPRTWRILRWPYVVIFVLLSIGVAIVLYQPSVLQAMFKLDHLPMTTVNWIYMASFSVALLAGSLLAIRFAIRHYPGRSIITWSVWLMVAITAFTLPVARGNVAINPIRSEAEDLLKRINVQQVLWLNVQPEQPSQPINPTFMLYSRRGYTAINFEQIDQTVEQLGRFLILSPDTFHPKTERLKKVARYPNAGLILWQVDPNVIEIELR